MDCGLNPAAFQYFAGFGFHNFCLTGCGLDHFLFNVFASFDSVSGLHINWLSLVLWSFLHPTELYVVSYVCLNIVL